MSENPYTLHLGDSRIVLREMRDNSVDSIVCDPPYEIGMMGKKWDSTGIAYNVILWRDLLRVIKPGGYLLAFGGTRTYHRMTCAIEDAGWEIRDCLQWLYGTGYPKSRNISKAIDSEAGVELGEPSTEDAKTWDGWGTALKPGNEPIVLARAPISEKTIADNVLKHGTGGLNIGGCRLEAGEDYAKKCQSVVGLKANVGKRVYGKYNDVRTDASEGGTKGRWPANVILDPEAAAMLDEQSGETSSTERVSTRSWGVYKTVGGADNSRPCHESDMTRLNHDTYGDSGGASRFFYCAKASASERGALNEHPTVKPLKLMRWLVRLVTPPGGVVMDPFMGSGSTGVAAMLENFRFVGIEKEEKSFQTATDRISGVANGLSPEEAASKIKDSTGDENADRD